MFQITYKRGFSSLVGKIRPCSPTPASLIPSLVFFPATSLIPSLSVLRCPADHLAKCMLVWMVRIWHKHFSMGHLILLSLSTLLCWSPPAPALPAQSSPPTPHVNSQIEITWAAWDRPIHVPLSLWRAFTHSCRFPLLAMLSLLSLPASYRCSRSEFRWYLWEAFAEPSGWMDVSASPLGAHPHPGDSLASLTSFFTGLEASGGGDLSSFLDLATE